MMFALDPSNNVIHVRSLWCIFLCINKRNYPKLPQPIITISGPTMYGHSKLYRQVRHIFFSIKSIYRHFFIFPWCAGLGGSIGCASDWRPGGCGFDPRRGSNVLSWRLIMKYFLRSFSSTDSRRAVVSFWRKNVHSTG